MREANQKQRSPLTSSSSLHAESTSALDRRPSLSMSMRRKACSTILTRSPGDRSGGGAQSEISRDLGDLWPRGRQLTNQSKPINGNPSHLWPRGRQLTNQSKPINGNPSHLLPRGTEFLGDR